VEGATFALRDCLEVMRDLGIAADQIRLSGGGARSPFWRQLQADIYGQKVALVNAQEGPAFGVALLAMVGAGEYRNVPEACSVIKVTEEIHPRGQVQRIYDHLYAQYARFYSLLESEFRGIAKLVGQVHSAGL